VSLFFKRLVERRNDRPKSLDRIMMHNRAILRIVDLPIAFARLFKSRHDCRMPIDENQ